MISINSIPGQTISRARELSLPVKMTGPASFTLPSATRPQLTEHHQVTFDSETEPTAFSCSREAARHNSPCWAAARARDVLVLLSANGVTFSAPFEPEAGGGGGQPSPADSFDEDGRVEFAVQNGGPLPRRDIVSNARFVGRAVTPEPDPDAVLVAPSLTRTVVSDGARRRVIERRGPFVI